MTAGPEHSSAGTASPGTRLADGLIALARMRGLGSTLEAALSDTADERAALAAARRHGLLCRRRQLTWDDLGKATASTPALVRLHNGRWLMLLSIGVLDGTAVAMLADPSAPAEAIHLDSIRFADAWTGDAVVLRPAKAAPGPRAFGWRAVAGVILEEPRLLRDAIAATVALAAVAAVPILVVQLLLGRVLPAKASHSLLVLGCGLVLALVIEAVLRGARGALVTRLAARTQARLAGRLFDRLLGLPVSTLEAMPVGEARLRFNDLRTIGDTLATLLPRLGLEAAVLVVFVAILALLDPLLAAAGVAVAAAMAAGLVTLLPRLRRAGERVAVARGHRDAFLVQSLGRMTAIKALAMTADRVTHWDRLTAALGKARLDEARIADTLQAAARPAERILVLGILALGVGLAGWRGEAVPVVRLITIALFVQRLVEPLAALADLARAQARARIATRSLGILLNRPPETTATPEATGAIGPGAITVERVRFAYADGGTAALRDVSFAVAAGTTLGILGRSGAGKTTLVRLLQRLYNPGSGTITIDGIDIRTIGTERLRRAVVVVAPSSPLFAGTIRDAITAARPDATFAQIAQAAYVAGADEFIERLPRGFDTMLHDGAPSLSAGQRQRLALARALVCDPPILVLDEALSALDAEIEAVVEARLREARAGRTTILITHRPSALMAADAILVMADGVVLDTGTHAALLERCDAYRRAWRRQPGALESDSPSGEGLLAAG